MKMENTNSYEGGRRGVINKEESKNPQLINLQAKPTLAGSELKTL